MPVLSNIKNKFLRQKKRKRYAVYGNCQVKILASFLDSSVGFSAKFERWHLPGIHIMSPVQLDEFMASISDIELFIYQPVKRPVFDVDKILEALPDSCIKISIPSLFFNSYNPEVSYLRESASKLFYHDRFLLQHLRSYEEFERSLMVSDDWYPYDFSLRCIEIAIHELRRRERNHSINVIMSNYIENNFRDHRLFNVLNHPSQELIRVLAVNVLDYIGIDSVIDDVVLDYDLDLWQFPIYKSHYKNCGFSFGEVYHYVWDGIRLTPREFFDRQAAYYATLSPKILERQKFELSNPRLNNWDMAGEFASSNPELGC